MSDSSDIGAAPPSGLEPGRGLSPALLWGGVALACVALAGNVVLWQRLSWTQQEMARRAVDVGQKATEARTLSRQSSAEVQAVQAKLALAEARLAEVALQRTQLEELMLSLSRSRDDNLVLDLEAGVRLAYQQSDLTGSAQPLIASLQSASQRIERAAQPRLNAVLRAMERDLEKLKVSHVMDVPSLVQRLDAAAQRADMLALANDVPLASQDAPPRVSNQAQAKAASEPVGPDTGIASLWAQFWDSVLTQSKSLLRVSRIDRPEASLLAPEQAYFLRGNVKLLLLNARMAILARQPATARSDIQRVLSLLDRFFDPKAAEVKALVQSLNDLLQDVAEMDLPRPDDTLTALAAAAAGR
jgi:uroporphyrin-3 C-methyltransferase